MLARWIPVQERKCVYSRLFLGRQLQGETPSDELWVDELQRPLQSFFFRFFLLRSTF
jgi:hypothetical protein